jgi:hypothetical protein
MSDFQANNGYDHYNNNLTTQLLNHLTRSEVCHLASDNGAPQLWRSERVLRLFLSDRVSSQQFRAVLEKSPFAKEGRIR